MAVSQNFAETVYFLLAKLAKDNLEVFPLAKMALAFRCLEWPQYVYVTLRMTRVLVHDYYHEIAINDGLSISQNTQLTTKGFFWRFISLRALASQSA